MTLPYGVIDALVKALHIGQLGFVKPKPEYDENDAAFGCDMGGRPCYHPADLLKLYLYGYYNRIRYLDNYQISTINQAKELLKAVIELYN